MRADVGQLLWLGFEGSSCVPPAIRARLANGRCGATVLFPRNIVTTKVNNTEHADLDALAELIRDLHQPALDGTPALVAIDHEGGSVQRVRTPATVWPPMLAFDELRGDAGQLAVVVGRAIGTELRALGIDVNFAPVLDVHTNPSNPIIGDRAFGRAPESVTERGLAFARGLADAGVLSCGKHFPGHGDTDRDSHLDLPRCDHDLARLEQVELVPFARAAGAELPMFMTAHIVFAAIDPARPATLSPQVITGLLRERLGYRGVVVTDDLGMGAIADHHLLGDAAVDAIRAGCDVALVCTGEENQVIAEEALIVAAESDSELRRRIGESAGRIRAMKIRHLADQTNRSPALRSVIGSAEHRRLAALLAGTM